MMKGIISSSQLRVTTATAAVAVLLAAPAVFYLFQKTKPRKDEPPISSSLPFIGDGLKFVSDFEGLMRKLRQKHGPIFTIVNFGQRMTFITDYHSIRKIWANPAFGFQDFADNAEANFSGMQTVEEIKKSGVGAPDLARLAHRMRGEDDLNSLAKRFQTALEEAVALAPKLHEPSWEIVELREFCGLIVFFAAGRSLFGKKWLEGVDIEEAAKQYSIFENDAPAMVAGMPKFILQKGYAARDYLTAKVLLPIVKDGCQDGHPYLTAYIAMLKEAYVGIEQCDHKVASRLVGLLFAIMTNTMNTLFWTLARIQLSLSAKSKGQLEQEMGQALKEFPTKSSYLDCKRNMPLLNSIILETFRLHSDPNSFRVVAKDCVVSNLAGNKDWSFRKGDYIFLLSTYEQLKNVNDDDKDQFVGDRWTTHTSDPVNNEDLLPVPSNQVFAPFGGGKHLCPGRFFALLEMHLVVAFCCKNYEFQIIDDDTSQLPPKIVELAAPVNQPKSKMMVSLRYKA